MPTEQHEHCPFCKHPIKREYGSFRCKNCAKSSEDLLDLERKARVAERRKARPKAASRKESDTASLPPAEKRKLLALAIARHAARKKQRARG